MPKKIKKCPFCGAKPIVETHTNTDRLYSMYSVKCNACNMAQTKYYDDRNFAITMWNTRV